MTTLMMTLNAIARKSPNKVAVIGKQHVLSYGELVNEVEKAAFLLQDYRGQVVALLADNSPEWLIIDLAAKQAGVVLLPLPVYFTEAQIQHAMQSAAASVLIYQKQFEPVSWLTTSSVEAKVFGDYPLWWVPCPVWPAALLPVGTDKITFTSGSTGTPKGVCLSQDQQENVAQSLISMTGLHQPRHLAVLPLSTLLENIAGLYAPLLAGGEVVLMPITENGYLAGPQAFIQTIDKVRPNTLILVPELLGLLLNAVQSGWQPPASLTFIAVGGSRVSAELINKTREFGLPVYEGYGLSEASSVVSLNSLRHDKPGTAGKILPHLKVTQEAGEIVVYGSQFLGYIGAPALKGQALHTGDIGKVDEEGFLHIQGRKKQLLISSYGRNISPEWIESEVMSQPNIQQCVVFGDAKPFCSALIFSTLSDAAVQQHLNRINQQLPDYARIYRWYRLQQPLRAEQGLLTANGRPKRPAIYQKYQHIIENFYQENDNDILCDIAS
ncbi:AMP-binding protein [Methylophaga sp. OBS3]|uniref:AMP-binding protein n=1 Tax=Methylophaga sp. OBS3 TaxID=2991934 RepID=UPI00225053C8|nr:AMP-binding protein [Methylophaga sp. OBS3]MCX4189633.1 AMP-binding protein [Methylophaga sp. OBS3]